MLSKGISPLIAAVLLIAFVMAAAAVLSGWVIEFTREKTKVEKRHGEEITTCPFASLEILSATYNCTSNDLYLKTENRGRIDLKDFTMQVVFKNATHQWVETFSLLPANITLRPGQFEIFYNQNVGKELDEVIIMSAVCPVTSQAKAQKNEIGFVDC
jgi:flagellin-like protein